MGQLVILPPYIISIHGRISKKDDIVFYTRYGKTFSKILPYCNPAPTPAQKTCREIFKEANALMWKDLRDKNKKIYWETIAAQSNGEYKSARGAALAHHYKELSTPTKTTEEALINIEIVAAIVHELSENSKQHANRQHNSVTIVPKHKSRTPIYLHPCQNSKNTRLQKSIT